jgi:hypothetical protein
VEIAFGIFVVVVVIDRLIQWLSDREQTKFNSAQLLFTLHGFAELTERVERLENNGLDEETEEGGLDGSGTVPQGGETSPIPDVLRSL